MLSIFLRLALYLLNLDQFIFWTLKILLTELQWCKVMIGNFSFTTFMLHIQSGCSKNRENLFVRMTHWEMHAAFDVIHFEKKIDQHAPWKCELIRSIFTSNYVTLSIVYFYSLQFYCSWEMCHQRRHAMLWSIAMFNQESCSALLVRANPSQAEVL